MYVPVPFRCAVCGPPEVGAPPLAGFCVRLLALLALEAFDAEELAELRGALLLLGGADPPPVCVAAPPAARGTVPPVPVLPFPFAVAALLAAAAAARRFLLAERRLLACRLAVAAVARVAY